MAIEKERIVSVLGFMYGYHSEIVVNIPSNQCRLFINTRNQLELTHEEVSCLLENQIIEQDGGCNEQGHQTKTYVLTSLAQQRIRSILQDKQLLQVSS